MTKTKYDIGYYTTRKRNAIFFFNGLLSIIIGIAQVFLLILFQKIEATIITVPIILLHVSGATSFIVFGANKLATFIDGKLEIQKYTIDCTNCSHKTSQKQIDDKTKKIDDITSCSKFNMKLKNKIPCDEFEYYKESIWYQK